MILKTIEFTDMPRNLFSYYIQFQASCLMLPIRTATERHGELYLYFLLFKLNILVFEIWMCLLLRPFLSLPSQSMNCRLFIKKKKKSKSNNKSLKG